MATPYETFIERKKVESKIRKKLNTLNAQIKNAAKREDAYQSLLTLETEFPSNIIRKQYLRGKYWAIKARSTSTPNIDALLNAEELYDCMVVTAREHGIALSEKQFFVRINIKLQLGKALLCKNKKEAYIGYAAYLLNNTIERFGLTSQLAWLQSQFPNQTPITL